MSFDNTMSTASTASTPRKVIDKRLQKIEKLELVGGSVHVSVLFQNGSGWSWKVGDGRIGRGVADNEEMAFKRARIVATLWYEGAF